MLKIKVKFNDISVCFALLKTAILGSLKSNTTCEMAGGQSSLKTPYIKILPNVSNAYLMTLKTLWDQTTNTLQNTVRK